MVNIYLFSYLMNKDNGSAEFTAAFDYSLGFSTITVKNGTHLLFEHI